MQKCYAVRSLSWTREAGYVKVPHPVSRRMVYLPGELGAVFELIDEGTDADEITKTLATGDPGFDRERLDSVLDRLVALQLIDTVSQFG